MANIRDSAKAFVPKTTKNVADLDAVNLEWSVEDRKGKNEEGKEFDYKVVVKDGEDYRIPASVLNQIKTIVECKPNQKTVRVIKKGTGMNTEYTTIQLD
jgi:hypothetical protein